MVLLWMHTKCSREVGKGEKNQKQVHVWAAIGQNFKSNLTFYDVSGNTNRKMSLTVYHDDILEPFVKPWIFTNPTWLD